MLSKGSKLFKTVSFAMASTVEINRAFLCLICVSLIFMREAQSLFSCDGNSIEASSYQCNPYESPDNCNTFAVFYGNPNLLSLTNLSSYLNLNRTQIMEANDLPANSELLERDQPLLIPLECRCSGGFFSAQTVKTTVKDDTFSSIAASLEGLTTCKAITESNPKLSPWLLKTGTKVMVPLRCACPNFSQLNQGMKFLISYPVHGRETVYGLASAFNVTVETIASANNISGEFKPDGLVSNSTVFIPLSKKPTLKKATESISIMGPTQMSLKRERKKRIKLYIVVSCVSIVAILAIIGGILMVRLKRKKKPAVESKTGDLELQISRTPKNLTEVSQEAQEKKSLDKPEMVLINTFSLEDLRKATENFNPSNLIEGSVFHALLNGKNLAIKKIKPESVANINLKFLQSINHPNLVKLIGSCTGNGIHSYLVFDYAKNGSLKDWLHGGLAIKNQFIASCYCFLTWKQRLKICLNVAQGLQFIHSYLRPGFVHKHLTSRTILLDEEFNAKIAGFGLAECSNRSEGSSEISSYLAPEFVSHHKIAPSIDIFAFGVILIEVLSGTKPESRAKEGESVPLSERINSALLSDDVESEIREWVDTAFGEDYSYNAALSLANLAKSCVEEDPCLRPSSEEIVEKLSKMVEELPDEEKASSFGSCSKIKTKDALNMDV